MFAHNAIEINAPVATVWTHLVQAELWPQWLPKVGKVKVNGDSHMLEKNTNFTWSGFDLPPEYIRFLTVTRVESRVVEYAPENRLSWVTYAPNTIYGPLCDSYHTWLLTPAGAKKCRVIFEDIATGLAALHARGSYPEVLHLSHQRWLEGLKRISETGNSKRLTPVSHF
ncbi:MAG: SRPBCC domain-containing protein [Verrucomicrobia bacterium]|nr:SRPBCC domain-containing protein [Verrucomicrobiota bacterium]